MPITGAPPVLTTDGTHFVPVTKVLHFVGATVANAGGGVATVTVSGGGGELQTVKVTISQADLTTLFSSPVEAIPAPGAGKVIALVSCLWQYRWEDAVFLTAVALPAIGYIGSDFSGSAMIDFQNGNTPQFGGNYDQVGSNPPYGIAPDFDVINKAIVIATQSDLGIWGPITALTLNAGGALYAPGDTGIVGDGSADTADATYVVDTVDGGGAVLTATLTAPGTSYTSVTADPTTNDGAQPGIGTGLKFNVTVSTPATGYMQFDLSYLIVDALT